MTFNDRDNLYIYLRTTTDNFKYSNVNLWKGMTGKRRNLEMFKRKKEMKYSQIMWQHL
jgi:hypothetical protein